MTAAKTHQQTLDKVQNQAMRTTPVEKMEQITGIPPLYKQRKSKTLIQATKYTHIKGD